MARAPLQFSTITCKHCGAIVALIPPGAIVYDTRLRCIHCSIVVVIVKPVDKRQQKAYTELQPA